MSLLWPEVIYQKLHCLPKKEEAVPWLLRISISTQRFISRLCTVTEICKLKLKNDSELHAHLFPYCNICPEVAYCCFI